MKQALGWTWYRLKRFLRRPKAVERPTALADEVAFWRQWLETGGLQWPGDYRARLDPATPIQPHVARFIDRLDVDPVHVLDIGSGPITKLGRTHPQKRLVITPTDLLADEYDRLLREFDIVPPARTVYGDAENLVEQFGADRFDIVHGQNCIDHTADPLRAIEQMVAVCRPGGYVVLYHAENEGARERYDQLHQWDFTCSGGRFVIGDRWQRTTDVSAHLADRGEVECHRVRDPGAREYGILVGIRRR